MKLTSTNYQQPFLVIILLIAIVTRILTLDSAGVWVDEAHTIIVAQKKLTEICELSKGYRGHSVLYYTILKIFMYPFQSINPTIMVRGFSILGLLTLAISTKKLFATTLGKTTSTILTILTILIPSYYSYAIEARPYTWIYLSMSLFIASGLNMQRNSSAKATLLFSSAIAFNIYLHLFTIPLMLMIAMSNYVYEFIFEREKNHRKMNLKPILAIACTTLVLITPLLILSRPLSNQDIKTKSFLAISEFDAHTIAQLLTSPFRQYSPYWLKDDLTAGTFVLLFTILIVGYSFVSSQKDENNSKTILKKSLFIYLLTSLTIIGLSFVKPLIIDRYYLFLNPILLITIATSIAIVLESKYVISKILIYLFLVSLYLLNLNNYPSQKKSNIDLVLKDSHQTLSNCHFIYTNDVTMTVFYYFYPTNQHTVLIPKNHLSLIDVKIFSHNVKWTQVNNALNGPINGKYCFVEDNASDNSAKELKSFLEKSGFKIKETISPESQSWSSYRLEIYSSNKT